VSMDAKAFQDTAERLARESAEGDWRSAASRGYYAVFHFFLGFFRSHGLDLGTAGSAHPNLYLGLYNCGVAAVKPVAREVDRLRRLRTDADYNLRMNFSQALAARAVRDTAQVVGDFQAVLTTVAAADVVDGARNHLRSIGRLPP
jgi:hypothetical protein